MLLEVREEVVYCHFTVAEYLRRVSILDEST